MSVEDLAELRMATLVADTSGLVSLGVAAGPDPAPLALRFTTDDVLVPEAIVAEFRELASYDDSHGRAAAVVLDRLDEVTTESVTLDADFPC